MAEWVGAVGTLLAVAWALFLYRRSIRERSEEAARQVYPLAQRLGSKRQGEPAEFGTHIHDIYVHDDLQHTPPLYDSPVPTNSMRKTIVPGETALTVMGTVVNGSNEPISTVNFEVTRLDGATVREFAGTIDVVLPGHTRSVALLMPHFKDENNRAYTRLNLTACIRFSDSSGCRWRRVTGLPVEPTENEWFNGRRPRTFRRDLRRLRRTQLAKTRKAVRYFWPRKNKSRK